MTGPAHNRLAVLAEDIRTNHAGVKAAAEVAAAHAIAAGQALVEAKSLVMHGQWLPWLENHCGFSERTAQLYMRIAEKGVGTDIVAALGLKAAAGAFQVIDHHYDPFANSSDEQRRDWLLFACFIGSWTHIEWVIQKRFVSPDEWLGPIGEAQRGMWGMQPISDECRAAWVAFRVENLQITDDALQQRLAEVGEHDARPATPKRKRTRRRSAPVADLTRSRETPASLADRLRQVLASRDLDARRAEIAEIAAALGHTRVEAGA